MLSKVTNLDILVLLASSWPRQEPCQMRRLGGRGQCKAKNRLQCLYNAILVILAYLIWRMQVCYCYRKLEVSGADRFTPDPLSILSLWLAQTDHMGSALRSEPDPSWEQTGLLTGVEPHVIFQANQRLDQWIKMRGLVCSCEGLVHSQERTPGPLISKSCDLCKPISGTPHGSRPVRSRERTGPLSGVDREGIPSCDSKPDWLIIGYW